MGVKTFEYSTSSNDLLRRYHEKTQGWRTRMTFETIPIENESTLLKLGIDKYFVTSSNQSWTKVIIIKKFAIQKISSKYFQTMNLIGFQEFSALAPLLQLLIFFQMMTFFKVMTLILYEFFLRNWENVDGSEKSINFFYKKQSFLSSNDNFIFMTKYDHFSYKHEFSKVFYPLFKSFLPHFSMFFPPSYTFHLLKFRLDLSKEVLFKIHFHFLSMFKSG